MRPPIFNKSTTLFFITLLLCVSTFSNSFAIGFDSTFATGGKFTGVFADGGQPSSSGSRVFLQPSGRIVVVGSHTQDTVQGGRFGIGLAGLTPGGILDAGFGNGGRMLFIDAAANQYNLGSLMQSDGSIIVLYQRWQSSDNNTPAVIKFTPNGQVDPTYQADVQVTPNQTAPMLIARGSGGKAYVLLRNFSSTVFTLIRLNENGSRDLTFGPNGSRVLPLNRFGVMVSNPAISVLIELANGKLLLGGTYFYTSFPESTFLFRFDSDLNIDRSFGLQGSAILSLPGGGVGIDTIAVQSDGKILLGGAYTFLGSNALLMRLTPRGRRDGTFGSDGIAMSTFNDVNSIRGLALEPDGKIITAGFSGDKAFPSNARVLVMRYSAAGVRESFLVTNFITDREAGAYDVVLQPDGKMIVAGFTQNAADNLSQVAVARFVP